jgi:ATP-dependent Lon protease
MTPDSPNNPADSSDSSSPVVVAQEVMTMPILPLRDVVVFPQMVIPLFVGRPKSIKAIEMALQGDKSIFLTTQKNPSTDSPTHKEVSVVGCQATIVQLMKLPDNTVKILVEGIRRCRIIESFDQETHYSATVAPMLDVPAHEDEQAALCRSLHSNFEQFVKIHQKIPDEVLGNVANVMELGRLCDLITAHLPIKLDQRQELLAEINLQSRAEKLLATLEGEMHLVQVEKKIRGRVKKAMEKSQREYYLNEQVKAIQRELGEGDEIADLDELEKRIKAVGMSKEGLKKAESELKKLKLMSPMSAEATVSRNFLDAMVKLPWRKKSRVSKDLLKAKEVLEAEHFGLEKVKERIVEYLAVQQRVEKMKAPIMLLVGPPGVGKTSLGQSIARATNRKFVRMSLGGMRDEAEIRGHRRTYIGSMPGRILQSLTKINSKNPLFLLDEVDKIGQDFRGDPASALLEVLDPEQNHTFQDHYLEVDFDLSEVMFIATANSLNIPAALLDRMEIIRLSGYTEDEKAAIARQYLIPKQMKNNGIRDGELEIKDSAVRSIIRYYTREAGVRALEREIAKMVRITVKNILLNPAPVSSKNIKSLVIDESNVHDYLGVRKYSFGVKADDNQVGICTGLAWTEVGGDLLTIEALALPGKGTAQFTGKLGEVMQESIKTALSVVRRRAHLWGINPEFYQKSDMHIHVPEGATPKDGPSAGAAMTTALISLLTNIPVHADVAMTGEITLRGEVLEIGGLKEKLLAALRGGIRKVLIPKDNEKDLAEIPDNVKKGLEIVPVRWIEEVIFHALINAPQPNAEARDPMEAILALPTAAGAPTMAGQQTPKLLAKAKRAGRAASRVTH